MDDSFCCFLFFALTINTRGESIKMKEGKVKKAKALLGGNLPSRALLKTKAPSPRAP